MLRQNAQTTAAAITADRVRIDNILSSPEAKRNPALAQRLAVVRGMDEATAREVLASSPALETPYEAAMKLHGVVPAPGVDAASAAGGRGAGPEGRKAARTEEIREAGRIFNSGRSYADAR